MKADSKNLFTQTNNEPKIFLTQIEQNYEWIKFLSHRQKSINNMSFESKNSEKKWDLKFSIWERLGLNRKSKDFKVLSKINFNPLR